MDKGKHMERPDDHDESSGLSAFSAQTHTIWQNSMVSPFGPYTLK